MKKYYIDPKHHKMQLHLMLKEDLMCLLEVEDL